jgi:hypothetical protein
MEIRLAQSDSPLPINLFIHLFYTTPMSPQVNSGVTRGFRRVQFPACTTRVLFCYLTVITLHSHPRRVGPFHRIASLYPLVVSPRRIHRIVVSSRCIVASHRHIVSYDCLRIVTPSAVLPLHLFAWSYRSMSHYLFVSSHWVAVSSLQRTV